MTGSESVGGFDELVMQFLPMRIIQIYRSIVQLTTGTEIVEYQGSSPRTSIELGFLLDLEVNKCTNEVSEFLTPWRPGVESASGKRFFEFAQAMDARFRRLTGWSKRNWADTCQ